MKVDATLGGGGSAVAEIHMKTWTTNPPPNSYDAPNPGTIRTGFELNIPAKSRVAIVVSLVPEGAGSASRKIGPLADWKKD
ncbi:hypothetical protein ACQ86N_00665 [Puia sp. P3]|uniref:hypothetical protein n=1 Tax=Puia sp. P3 TaxID=3423952 RepID=UPI003D665FB1